MPRRAKSLLLLTDCFLCIFLNGVWHKYNIHTHTFQPYTSTTVDYTVKKVKKLEKLEKLIQAFGGAVPRRAKYVKDFKIMIVL